MRPLDIQQIGEELAIKWDDGSESFLTLERLRRGCPCAGCQGEVDVMGELHQLPGRELTTQAFELRRILTVGSYALQPVWADGHDTGLYAFAYLKQLADLPNPPST